MYCVWRGYRVHNVTCFIQTTRIMEVVRDEDYGAYEFKKNHMPEEQEPERRGCGALSAVFAMVMMGLMVWGFYKLAN